MRPGVKTTGTAFPFCCEDNSLYNNLRCVCSKNEVQMVLRKLIAMHVIHEETWRQDNQYGNVVACLKVNRQQADAFLASSQPIKLPFLVPARGQSVTSAAVPAPTKKGQPCCSQGLVLLKHVTIEPVAWSTKPVACQLL